MPSLKKPKVQKNPKDVRGKTPDDGAQRKERTPYHGAAFGAFSCLFCNYRQNGKVTIVDEHRLSKEPLRIDIVVIKKDRDIELEPVWAKIFRAHNLVEYKSPADKAPTFEVFSKLMGYAWIYAAQEKVKISDMTATLICAVTPKKLLKILKDDFDYELLEKYDGVYYIIQKGVAAEKSLAIQIMTQSSELLLQALDKKPLDEAAADKVAEFIAALDKENMNKLSCWLKALAPKNAKIISERMVRNMTKTDKVYLEVLESLGHAERLRQEGRQEGALKVIELLEKGYSLTDAKKKLKLA
jgi:hypothetical protein